MNTQPYRNLLQNCLQLSIEAQQSVLSNAPFQEAFGTATAELVEAYRQGHRLYLVGNGGSAADAQHLATEFVSRLARERGPLPAEALTVDTSTLTAIGNDYGFEALFSRQIYAKMRPGDMLLAITTSGRSPNILRALEACREQGCRSILLTGRDGGPAAELADHVLLAPGIHTSTIQEVHILIAHALCACVENEMFPLKG